MFLKYLYTEKNLRPVTAKNYAFFAGKFTRSNQSPEEFLCSYSNASSHDNAVNGRVFNFDAHKIRNSLKAICTSLRPHDMRDFFYNHARRSGVDKDLVEWCMGHSIGIRAHDLGDNVKEEYAKFEEKFRLL